MDEQIDEHDEMRSERSAVEEQDEEEEEQIIDNRSIQGDTELEIPSYFCNTCMQPHFNKCFAIPSTLSVSSDQNSFTSNFKSQSKNHHKG